MCCKTFDLVQPEIFKRIHVFYVILSAKLMRFLHTYFDILRAVINSFANKISRKIVSQIQERRWPSRKAALIVNIRDEIPVFC